MWSVVYRLVLAIGLSLALAAHAAAGPLEDVLAAAGQGDYATTLTLANGAQISLGFAREFGTAFMVPQYSLCTYEDISETDALDYARAAEGYRFHAEQGSAFAQTMLGFVYNNGMGVQRDYAEAHKWYRLAAAQGDASAQTWLDANTGNAAFLRGDYAASLKLLKPLADQGDADAQFHLGFMYGSGHGVPQDDVLAYMWFNLAAGQSIQVAGENRDIVAGLMTRDQIAEAQKLSREWMAAHPQP